MKQFKFTSRFRCAPFRFPFWIMNPFTADCLSPTCFTYMIHAHLVSLLLHASIAGLPTLTWPCKHDNQCPLTPQYADVQSWSVVCLLVTVTNWRCWLGGTGTWQPDNMLMGQMIGPGPCELRFEPSPEHVDRFLPSGSDAAEAEGAGWRSASRAVGSNGMYWEETLACYPALFQPTACATHNGGMALSCWY
jgi:hypothetical protein